MFFFNKKYYFAEKFLVYLLAYSKILTQIISIIRERDRLIRTAILIYRVCRTQKKDTNKFANKQPSGVCRASIKC